MASQYGTGNKNPPWARQATDFIAANAVGGIATAQMPQVTSGIVQTSAMAASPTVYSYSSATAMQQQHQQQFAQSQIASVIHNQAGLQTAAAGVALSQPGMALPTTLGGGSSQVATVSYPTARPNQASAQAANAAASQKQRVFTGTVTKLHDNFGFIDEDVFFQSSCVKGIAPKVGDRVFVEASYNPAMPFKWNATRVQVLNSQASGVTAVANTATQQLAAMQQAAKTMGLGALGVAPGINTGGLIGGVNPMQLAGAMAAMNSASLINSLASQPRALLSQAGRGRGLIRGGTSTGRQTYSESSRYSEDRERERDRGRDRDRDRREKRDSRRRSRSSSPSSSRPRSPKRKTSRPPPRYVVQAPQATLNMPEAGVMVLKTKYSNMYIPSDFFHASFPWVDNLPLQRPFTLGQSCKFHVMHKEVTSLNPESAVLDPPDADHSFSAKVMLLACPSMEELYSKSCALAQENGEHQESFQHPTRLLQFLVGTRGKNEPMAIGGPWSPSLDGDGPNENPQVLIKTAIRTTKALTGIDLSKCTQWYRFAEIRYLRAETRDKPVRVETVVLFLPDVWRCSPTRLEWTGLQKSYMQKLHKKLNPTAEDADDQQQDSEDPGVQKNEPTHFSKLDPKTLKLQELRDELDSRNLSAKGLKSQLIARLTKALLSEQEKEEEAETMAAAREKEEEGKNDENDKEKEKDSVQKKEQEEEQKRKEKRDRQQLERRYTLPDSPSILVHPHPTAKSGKFDCSVMTLSLLLDYRPEDNKEHSFEVSLFAELFNEMLMRNFGFSIYKALVMAPAQPKEEEKKKKEKDGKDKDSKEKENKDSKDKDKDIKDKERAREKDRKGDSKSEEPPAKRRKADEARKDGDGEMDDDDERDDRYYAKLMMFPTQDSSGREEEDDEKRDKDKKEKDTKRDKRKFLTVDPELLLACVYYDQNHCGYIQEHDLEDIIYSLGIDLSRAQVRKLVQKVLARECFHYRKMTDVPQARDTEVAMATTICPCDMEAVARGNSDYLVAVRTAGRVADRESGNKGEVVEVADNGREEGKFVRYKGSVVDLESLIQKLEGSDKSCALLENRLADMAVELEALKENLSTQEAAVRAARDEFTSTQAKLQAEVSRRVALETQQVQLEVAIGETKGMLQQALSVLSIVPVAASESSEKKAGDAGSKKRERKDPSPVSVKKEKI
ncbi:cell division cycle and apoptosis regulator protein 1-like isoform X3 [Pomacea canaliculata]|uniref:cell division cycle and apoptosis regulator protein 1-like isoform X3 n=1 Tax=Pomacea canaliculata TaxID=400727 RepID=UPI000D72B232|nr:cell division cycle and apoptosis regulator protein 1-like isoform X3 [Pomacea canaliculata]